MVPAAGRGERFEGPGSAGPPKQYAPLESATVLAWSLRALLSEPRIEGIVVVLAADDSRWGALAAGLDPARVLTAVGGASRQESVLNGLQALEQHAAADDWVLVHDAARPCLSAADVSALIDALNERVCGAMLAAPIVDTVKRERDGLVGDTVDRAGLWRALTPQVFGYAPLVSALGEAAREGVTVTDEAQAMERLGLRPLLVQGSPFNIKVTRAEDLSMASRILRSAEDAKMPSKMRIGQGFDVHAFGDGEHVVLGGVRIAYHAECVAHSDGDVVIHALCDAVLGALGEGDIGRAFSRQRSPLPRRRQPGVPARGGRAHARGRPAIGQRRRHRARRGAAHRRAPRRHGGESRRRSRQLAHAASTSRRPPRSAWASSAAARDLRRSRPCCSRD